MPIQSWGKNGVLAYFGPNTSYFGHIVWDMDFKFVFPIISIDIKGQTKLEVNWTKIDHFTRQKPDKWPYLKIPFCPSFNDQKSFSSCIFPWICLKLSESMYIIWISQILTWRIFDLGPKKFWTQNPKKHRFFWILDSTVFWGLNQKSAMISICEIHIYNDSESFLAPFLQISWQKKMRKWDQKFLEA